MLESGGRPSDELVSFVRTYGRGLGPVERSAVISTAWRNISRTLAVGTAEMLLSAGQCLGQQAATPKHNHHIDHEDTDNQPRALPTDTKHHKLRERQAAHARRATSPITYNLLISACEKG